MHLIEYKCIPGVTESVTYHLNISIAYRHMLQYGNAQKELQNGLKNHPDDSELKKESQLVNNLLKNSILKKKLNNSYANENLKEEKVFHQKKNKIKENERSIDYYQARNSENNQKFKILSIDGGGIRGIIPAFWLCELEKRTHKPIAQLFNMMAGTSSGGIIAASLSLPANNDGYTPKYSAQDSLDLFETKLNKFFNRSCKWPLFSKYLNDGRLQIYKEYFGFVTIDKSLGELLLTACSEDNLTSTYLFNRHDARKDPVKIRYIDALMATSAAPTYFPPHFMPGKGVFHDGGIHANNPAGLAYNEALRYGKSHEKIFILSMGTGGFIPPAFSGQSDRCCSFWATHLKDVALLAQDGDTDKLLSNTLGKTNYKRWQVWLEEEIKLDGYDEESFTKLLESANQVVEELYLNPIKKLNLLKESVDTQIERFHESDNEFNKLIENLVDD